MGVAGSREVVVDVHPVGTARIASGDFRGRKNARCAEDEDKRDKNCRDRLCPERREVRVIHFADVIHFVLTAFGGNYAKS